VLDSPLPLVPNQFTMDELESGGDALLGYGEDELLGFIPIDLNLFWNGDVTSTADSLDDIVLVGATTSDAVDCDDPVGEFDEGTAYCPSTDTVYLNEPVAREIYEALGDFSVGYLIGTAWSEAVQQALDTRLEGEERVLLNDCLTGAWVKTTIPVDGALPEPRGEERTVRVSAGDLDEAIQTIIGLADETSSDDVRGGLFEKIDAFRTGVVEGIDSCLADL
jgi:hypothetical protein